MQSKAPTPQEIDDIIQQPSGQNYDDAIAIVAAALTDAPQPGKMNKQLYAALLNHISNRLAYNDLLITQAEERGKQQALNAINALHQSGAAIMCAANCTCELCYLEARHAE